MRWILLPLLCAAAYSQSDTLRKTTFEDRAGLVMANGKLRLVVLPQGGSLADLTMEGDTSKLSPLWNPARLAREAGDKPRFGAAFGHFVCVDGFGPVSEEEKAAGLPGHGEAHLQPWDLKFSAKEGRTTTATFEAKLPVHQEVFRRTIRMVDGENVVYVESQLESLLGFDRPVVWAEHATIGAPFLEPGVTVVDMPVKRAMTRPYKPRPPGGLEHRLPSGQEFTWPNAPRIGGGKVDVRAAPATPNSGDHTTCLMDPQRKLAYVTALHPGKNLIVGWVFKGEEFPWVQSWEFYPPSKKLARGLEFSTQPFDAPRREAISLGKMFDAPTYRWLPAKSRIEARFLVFYAPAPAGMTRVDDVRLESGKLIVEDRKAKKTVTLDASLPL